MYLVISSIVKQDSKTGLKQEDNLSPMTFNCFIENLLLEIKKLNEGICIDNGPKLCILAYADDIILISPTPEGLQ